MPDVLSLFKDVYSVSENFRDLKFKKAMQALEKEVLDVQEENTKLRAENTKLSNHLNARAEMKPFGPHNYFYKTCFLLHRSLRLVLGGNVRFATNCMLRSPLNHYRQQSPLETQRRARDFFAKAAICNSATVRIEKRMGRAK